MSDPDDRPKDREVDEPTRLQRAARRGCAGLAYAIVLVPVVLVIWFFSTIPRGWEQFGDLVWKIVWEGPTGADTEIVVLNISGHDVQIDMIRFAEHRDHFTRPLEAERENDPDQNIVHYQAIISETSDLLLSLWRSDTPNWTREWNVTDRSLRIDGLVRNVLS